MGNALDGSSGAGLLCPTQQPPEQPFYPNRAVSKYTPVVLLALAAKNGYAETTLVKQPHTPNVPFVIHLWLVEVIDFENQGRLLVGTI